MNKLNKFKNSNNISEQYLNSVEINVDQMISRFYNLSSIYCAIRGEVNEEELKHFYEKYSISYQITISKWDLHKVSLIMHRLNRTGCLYVSDINTPVHSLEEALILRSDFYKGQVNV